jgi:hypothetical protein
MSLLAALETHGEAIEADFQRYYGVPVSGVFAGAMTWRRFKVLLGQLPAESATVRAAAGDAAAWTLTEHLLAGILDAEHAALWQRSGGKSHRPRPIERPGQAKARTHRVGHTTRTPAEVRAYLDRFKPAAAGAGSNGG